MGYWCIPVTKLPILYLCLVQFKIVPMCLVLHGHPIGLENLTRDVNTFIWGLTLRTTTVTSAAFVYLCKKEKKILSLKLPQATFNTFGSHAVVPFKGAEKQCNYKNLQFWRLQSMTRLRFPLEQNGRLELPRPIEII